ncbi:helix-hairpin-helix domain-containing protein [Streptomyces sp. Root369]|uniref:helix-hairpin-helix domain-containing protein n=1 Tax=Streptomyces sp. Root369 TaxID=1736523 RepID=UPI00070D0C77|nr:helix-hairpin-helix domain-containing protein [Streptomyces sp. Root369]KQW01955.1 DNA helicase RecD [Streptomyces sp. Root369]
MSTEPEPTEKTEPGTRGAATEPEGPGGAPGRATDGGAASAGGGEAGVTGGPGDDTDASARDSVAESGDTGAGGSAGADESADGASAGGGESGAAGEGVSDAPVGGGEPEADAGEGGDLAGVDADGAGKAQLSEAEAELAAQRLERERIARRKAEKQQPVESGAKLSGKAADLLAAVRAVESGAKPAAAVFSEPEPPRRPAQEPVRPRPVSAQATGAGGAVGVAGSVGGPAPETVEAVQRVLAEGGAPTALAPQVAAALGEGADEELRADPWQLLRVTGVRPEQADGFARELLGAECAPDDERRGRAVTVWLLEQAALAGHTALEMPALTAALVQRGVPDADAAVQSTIAEAEALVFQDALDPAAPEPAEDDEEGAERPVRILVGLERYALAEESLADGLARLINSVPKEDGSAEDWERAAASAKGSAAELIRAAAAGGLVLHTGGQASLTEPAALLTAARGLGLRAWAATHSPLGRDRFSALLQDDRQDGTADSVPSDGTAHEQPRTRPVATVAGLLSGAEGPGRDGDGAFDLDLLVVLDAPQLDVETAALLVESMPDGARLVLGGDPAVLWSAGPGRVFADLLAARICPQVASRRPDPGPLGELVSGIGIGELNQVEAPGKEVVIVPVRDAGEAVHRTVQLVADSVPRALGVPAEETQVITPGHGGAVGTRALNAALKERLNPGPGRFGGFDPGDRVAYSPAPGRTLPGAVVGADADGLHLTCAGEPVVVPKERVEQSVRHGWALTAHQAVGCRWPAVVAVLPGDATQALSRPWVYTAFGRADRHLSVVQGAEQALPRAVAEIPAKPRTTRLPVLLRTQTPASG